MVRGTLQAVAAFALIEAVRWLVKSAMDRWLELAHASSPAGEDIVLRERDGVFEIRFNGWEVMSSRASLSEAALGRLVCEGLAPAAPLVVIGGLGMGYTLRAALDALGPGARVVVSELLPAVVAWNRGPLAGLAGRPLDDGRVDVRIGSVVDVLAASRHSFDAVLLDVDNGPDAVLHEPNRFLYSAGGLDLVRGALAPDGVLGVWSADPSAGFERVLDAAGMSWRRLDLDVRGDSGPKHTLYLAHVAGCPLEPGAFPTGER